MGDPGQGPPIFAGGAVRPRAFVPGDHRAETAAAGNRNKKSRDKCPGSKAVGLRGGLDQADEAAA